MNTAPPNPLTDQQATGRLAGSYRWLEQQLFHLLGGWTTTVAEPTVKLFLDEQSFEYAWHAELWADRIPGRHDVAPSGFTAPAQPGLAQLFHDLAALTEPTATIEKLTSVYRVILPRLVIEYSQHLDRALTAGDDPTQRALRLVIADETAAWRAGEAHLQRLVTGTQAIDRAAEQQRRIERMVVETGGLTTLTI